jgi:hypothetical protein
MDWEIFQVSLSNPKLFFIYDLDKDGFFYGEIVPLSKT